MGSSRALCRSTRDPAAGRCEARPSAALAPAPLSFRVAKREWGRRKTKRARLRLREHARRARSWRERRWGSPRAASQAKHLAESGGAKDLDRIASLRETLPAL